MVEGANMSAANTTKAVGKPLLELQGVTKVFGQGQARVIAVDEVDLAVFPGEILLIMGPSGSGKTTLLMLAAGLLRPTSGAIRIDGDDMTAMSERELGRLRRHKIGFVFQSFNLLAALNARENVEVALNLAGVRGKRGRERAITLLREFELSERLNARPEQLSGGEKQRVSIARALANDPDIIFADEPTANLDSKRGHEVMELLRNVAKERGKTVIIVSHDNRIRDIADRVLWLEDGRFKHLAAVVHDPVCGMAIDETKAAATSVFEGKTYYFCAPGCKRFFDENPRRFAAAPEAVER